MKRIMVVDDCAATLAQVVGILERAGYTVIATDDPTEAPMMVVTEEPSALILDLEMEGVSGWELISLVRSWANFANIPILALAARGSADLIEGAIAAGASDCLVKPVHEGMLLTHVTSRFWPEVKRVAGPTPADTVPRMATAGLGRRLARPSASGSARAVVAAKTLASQGTGVKPWGVMGPRKV